MITYIMEPNECEFVMTEVKGEKNNIKQLQFNLSTNVQHQKENFQNNLRTS